MKQLFILISLAMLVPALALAGDATEATKKANDALKAYLPFDDTTDFENAKRGFIKTLESGEIKDANGKVIYSMKQFDFIKGEAPDTVNPSLWRQSQINSINGLFEVGEGIYQIRAFDLAQMSFIRGKTGWIVVDPLLSTETAVAGYELLKKNVEDLPISAVIITHSHVDHYGGVKGLISAEEVAAGKPLIAPEHFFSESVNENLMAGNHMSRRAAYMYGNLLPKSPKGTVGSGLGQTTSSGTVTILKPNVDIKETPTELSVDGLKMIFMNTPGAEAPAELMFYIPEKKAMCQAEEINHTLHNLYTLRGAKVRSGLKWSKYIHQAIEMFGDEVEISFGCHHWPTWGNAAIVDLWKKQRDIYRYIHDEVLRLANHGGTLLEVAEDIKIPDSLAKTFANRGYYGSVNHDAKSQYQLYYGFFSGNPADLHPLPPSAAGEKFVDYMGGADAVIAKAKGDYERGEYRWAATALNYVVFADPSNEKAKLMLADTYEQLGYQAESGPWRNFYLTGAKELREGVKAGATPNTASPDTIRSLALETYLDYLAVRLNHPKAANTKITLNMTMPDKKQKFVIYVENGVLNYTLGKHADKSDAAVSINRSVLDSINLGQITTDQAIANGQIKIEGNQDKFKEFVSLLDTFEFWFNIVTP